MDAYVPVITFRFMGIEFDLLYAQMSSSLGGGLGGASFNIYDDQLLRSLDAKTVLSLNGARVTDMVLSLMPDTTVPAFRLALVFVKLWAKQRGIYSNVHGYLGGVSWAILTAQVCQLYPNAAASTLIEKFFALYKQWRWPFPITLNEPKTVSDLGLQVWNPKENFKDRADLMPIITPAYPAMNCLPVDHEILTRDGFLSYERACAALERDGRIEVACAVDGFIEYHPVSKLVEAEGDFMSYTFGSADSANGVHLEVTADHRMWARLATAGAKQRSPFGLKTAEDIVSAAGADSAWVVQLKANCDGGVRASGEPLPFQQPLRLTTTDQVNAFLSLYGQILPQCE